MMPPTVPDPTWLDILETGGFAVVTLLLLWGAYNYLMKMHEQKRLNDAEIRKLMMFLAEAAVGKKNDKQD